MKDDRQTAGIIVILIILMLCAAALMGELIGWRQGCWACGAKDPNDMPRSDR